ncbi:hypothetical protein EDB19DRAFT_1387239 [Suillus lakei]|nr:hypothetical protein EDB19DRAFT_1387239 [Suillus lakei]
MDAMSNAVLASWTWPFPHRAMPCVSIDAQDRKRARKSRRISRKSYVLTCPNVTVYVVALVIFRHQTGMHLIHGTITPVILQLLTCVTVLLMHIVAERSRLSRPKSLPVLQRRTFKAHRIPHRIIFVSLRSIVTDTIFSHPEVDDRPSESGLGGGDDGFILMANSVASSN